MEDVLIQMPLSDQKEISALLLDVEEGQDAKMENVYQPSIMALLAQLSVAFKGPHVWMVNASRIRFQVYQPWVVLLSYVLRAPPVEMVGVLRSMISMIGAESMKSVEGMKYVWIINALMLVPESDVMDFVETESVLSKDDCTIDTLSNLQ